ncbi:MAG: NAD(P)/FAD-dependent oxidoreductase [Moorella humiferrea]|nr:NAD(P)/FAD-dependent oxidoreductase [Moorella humiferrea]
MPNANTIAIIGNGAAAIHAVMALRESGYQDSIHIFSDSIWPSYNPMLTTYFAAGKIPLEKCFPFGASFDFYRRYGVDLHLGSPVVKLDAAQQIVQTASGESLQYSQCLIASGAAPILPPIPGLDSPRVFTMRTIEDALRLKAALEYGPRKALVVGASMVGIKVVELFYEAGLEVCLADLASQVFPLAAHPDCARLIEDYLAEKAIRLRLGAGLRGIETSAGGIKAYFSDNGPPKLADLVVICIGVRPNLQFIDPDQIAVDKGIIVDDHMRTSAPNIYAAGDVAQVTNLLTGGKEVIGLWANARYQGRTAGRKMAGLEDLYPGSIPHNITHFFDMVFAGIGDVRSGDYEEKAWKGDTYCHLVMRAGRLVGVNLLNCSPAAGILKQLILKGLNVPGSIKQEISLQAYLRDNLPGLVKIFNNPITKGNGGIGHE